MELAQVGVFIILGVIEYVHAGSSINIALNHPAYQISIYGTNYASRAVDGNRNTNMARRSCTSTHNSYNPWWCVDLGAIFHITRVTLVNRNGWAYRLNNINVGVMNSMPTTPLQPSSYDLCATFPGPSYASQVIILNCTPVCIHLFIIQELVKPHPCVWQPAMKNVE